MTSHITSKVIPHARTVSYQLQVVHALLCINDHQSGKLHWGDLCWQPLTQVRSFSFYTASNESWECESLGVWEAANQGCECERLQTKAVSVGGTLPKAIHWVQVVPQPMCPTCMTRMVSVRCISVSLASFFLREATLLSRCSRCRAYSECMSVSVAWSARAVC